MLTKIDVKYGNVTKIACMKGTLGERRVVRFLVEFRVFDFCVNSIVNFFPGSVYAILRELYKFGSFAMKLLGVIFIIFVLLSILHCQCKSEFKRFCCK